EDEQEEERDQDEITLVSEVLMSDTEKESYSGGGVVFILDSGATYHLVEENVTKFMTDIQNLDDDVKIRIANGGALIVRQKGNLKLEVNDRSVNVNALIVSSLT
ncbi:hypothetical protein JTB14_020805, partial [Gonioctena quinquepunctata]